MPPDTSLIRALYQERLPHDLDDFLAYVRLLLPLLDTLSNVVFFVKDTEARYRLVNQTLKTRLGIRQDADIIGLTPEQVFAGTQGVEYTAQDLKVLDEHPITDKLELHTYASGRPGWCITHKIPVYGRTGRVIAMAGVSIDIDKDSSHLLRHHQRLAAVVRYIEDHLEQKISVVELAACAGLSVSRLERLFKSVLRLSPQQMVQKVRLETAIGLLTQTRLSIVEIAGQCGYGDHSAFSRQFKQLTGQTPRDFRQQHGG
ncbi:AraC-like DNA-binding protein [Neisseria sp. HSC-16F19]|nr:AraC family transcriptional regulator [Neisseria sp. HSC-16F19]MCP2040384.1 AraC-like DNA-binding protein [Neisseria sp. HSC-16F19]